MKDNAVYSIYLITPPMVVGGYQRARGPFLTARMPSLDYLDHDNDALFGQLNLEDTDTLEGFDD